MASLSFPIAQVAVTGPFAEPLDYRVGHLRPSVGSRVEVPLGRRKVIGLVVSFSHESAHPADKLKGIQKLVDDEPLLPEKLLALLRWIAAYYHHPIGETLVNALPGMLKVGADIRSGNHLWQLTVTGKAIDSASMGRAERQKELLEVLQAGPLNSEILVDNPQWRQPLKRFSEKGWVASTFQPWQPDCQTYQAGPRLNAEQQQAVDKIRQAFSAFEVCLLKGVTGSGKTEVYLQAIEALADDQQVLVLVPEISLTPQLLARFKRLGKPLIALHSGMAEGERRKAWAAARDGSAKIVIGTRSAVLTPLPELALIIVDEEHDGSYKQQDGLRYHARDVAVRRAQSFEIPIVLGSATPSLESLANAKAKRYQLIEIKARAGAGTLPKFRVVDLRQHSMSAGLSPPLIQAIEKHLGQNGQVMLFLNRRGFAPVLMCPDCGWASDCHRCDARMTVHQKKNELHCHHCGSQRQMPKICPDCRQEQLVPAGQGTERLEHKIERLFPQVKTLRLDKDSTRRRGSLESALDEIRRGEAQIVIGTQMLTKGHDFPGVTLAAVVNADGGLFAVDFRAAERMAQLIVQMAGRAGRGDAAGEVIIQTHQPEHPLLQSLVKDSYEGFAEQALQERQTGEMPPYSYLAVVRAEAVKADAGQQFLQRALQTAKALLNQDVQVWGPAPAPMFRRAGRYRYQLLIHARSRKAMHGFLSTWLPKLRDLPQSRKTRWSVDVDPQDLY